MSIKPWLERRANAEVGPRDGKADELQKKARSVSSVAEVVSAPAPMEDHTLSRKEEVNSVLAEKVLHAFMQNRLQISFPLSLDLARHSPEESDLLLEAALVASSCSGIPKRSNVADMLVPARLTPHHLQRLEELHHRPERTVNALCDEACTKRLAPHAFAMAIMALPRPDACEQAFLGYLAKRLALRADVVEGLSRRYRR